MIYYGRQSISQEDIDAVVEVLKSPMITQGEMSHRFEQAVCEYTGASYAVACSHGTAALHLACLALGVSKGDIVWTVPNTFVASANCALYCGAIVDFVDIDAATFNISTGSLEQKLVTAKKQGRLPKVLIPVHFAGSPCAMDDIAQLAQQYDFQVIEDASHALGADFNSNKIGACEFSEIATFSFHPVKSITTGEGGMLVTNDKAIADRARLLANHGITRDRELMTKPDPEPWHYEQITLGYNYRMTDFQAALGLSQLSRLDEFVKKREMCVSLYKEHLSKLGLLYQQEMSNSKSSYHLFVLSLSSLSQGAKGQLHKLLMARGIVASSHYNPVHLHPFYFSLGYREGMFPASESYFKSALSLPLYPDLAKEELCGVLNIIDDFITASAKTSIVLV